MLDKHPFWSKGAVSSPLSHFWHILCFYFVWIWLAGVEGLIPLVSLFWTVDDDFSGRGLSTHSCLIHSLYTSRVLLHPQCPCYCQMSISGKHCEWINFLCVSVRSCMCVSTCCVHHTWAGGAGAAVESVWRQAASERHPSGTLPSWCTHEHMHRSKCIHIHHQLWKVPTVYNIYSTHNTHTFFYNLFLLLCSDAILLLSLFRM